MEQEVLFMEEQKFNQWYIWLALVVLNSIFIYALFSQVVGKGGFVDNPAHYAGFFIGFGTILLLDVFFYILKLQTIIKKDGIYVRFFPFHISFKRYSWSDLLKVYVKEYNPISDYGGWGLRIGSKGNALNVSGNFGLQLEISNNRNLLIGTVEPERIKEVLTSLGEYNRE